MDTVKIEVARLKGYDTWKGLGAWQAHFSEGELVALLARAADQAVRSQAYRQRAAEEMKVLKALVKANPSLLG